MKKIGVVMDPIERINPKTDTTLGLLLEAQARGYQLYYFLIEDLFIRDGNAKGIYQSLKVFNSAQKWFELGRPEIIELEELDAILMRKDPPFNMEYIYATYILEWAERLGVKIVNKPQSLRDANEKIFTSWFPKLSPPTMISKNMDLLYKFWQEQKDTVFKPVDGMAGRSIFLVKQDDVNVKVVIETLTAWGTQTIMAQKFIPEVIHGDKRVFMINGKPYPYALNRIPAQNSIRGNLAAGGTGVAVKLTEQDIQICQRLQNLMSEKNLFFVGLDIIGPYLTEINVTSPTGIRQIEEQTGHSIAKVFFDELFKTNT